MEGRSHGGSKALQKGKIIIFGVVFKAQKKKKKLNRNILKI